MGVGHCHHSEKHISNNMKVILSLFGLTMAMPHLQEPKNARSVNEMIDAVESGMASPEDPHARALFVSLTLTSTSTMLDTATVTTTVTNSCWAGTTTTTTTTTTSTTTTTTTAASGRRKREAMMFQDMVHDYTYGFTVIDVETGDEVDPMTIISPTQVARAEDVHDVLDADLVVDSDVELESGSLTWKEVAIDGRSRSSCARSDHGDEKRARIIALANEVVTLSLTSTSTITSTAATTKTFSVAVSCTTAGFSFGVPMC